MLHQLEKFSGSSEALPESALQAVIRKVGKTELRRRSVLQGLGGFVLAMYILPGKAEAYPAYPTHGSGMPNGLRNDPHIFVSIAPDGQVTIVAHRSEMGTGSRTSLPMIIADEMEADWHRVTVVQADGDEAKYGNQDTDGSRSLRHHIQPCREMGAAVRKMLELAAAGRGARPSGHAQDARHPRRLWRAGQGCHGAADPAA
jgi:isoquinoline 1-oxidoreductase subunit beta